MTVAVYQGNNAEKEWREDILRYSGLRHPNIVQLFGMASACGMHAAIFKDELIPVQQLFEKYSGSYLRMVYLLSFLHYDFDNAYEYIESVSGQEIYSADCTLWIRPSTGRLCVDPTDNAHGRLNLFSLSWDAPFSSSLSVLEPPEDSQIVDSISLECYHEICDLHFNHNHQLSISTTASMQLGAVILCPPRSELEHPNEIASIPDKDIDDMGWRASMGESLMVLESGWTRVDSSEVSDGNIFQQIYVENGDEGRRAWLTQANHIFHCLGITSNHDDYVLVEEIIHTIRFATGNSIPLGYLFLRSLADLQPDIPSHFRLSDSLAYWSLDPSGDERLSMEEAGRLGFPSFELEVEIEGVSWDESVYTGLRKFHQAKGFDPDSQNIALELGYPLFEISTDVDGTSAHVQQAEAGLQNDGCMPEEETHEHSRFPIVREGSEAMAEPSTTWKITMGLQFSLMFTLGALWLHDFFY